MRWPIVLSIFRRDLLEALRDRRALLLLIVVPMLLYPMLMVSGAMLTGALKKQSQGKPLKLAVWGPAPAWLLDRVEQAGRVEWTDRREALPADPSLDARALIHERKAHAVLALTPQHAPGAEDNLGLELYIDGSRSASAKAREWLSKVFEQARIHTVRERFQQAGLSPELAEPLQVKESNFRSMGVWLTPLLIYLVFMALMLAGFYPAIDVTAGEKERGTLQTLLCAPVRPLEVVLGKYGVVFVFALGGGLINLLGIGLAAVALGGMGGALSGIQVSVPVLLGASGALVPLTLLVSALFIAVGVMARSFKEAQNYLTPLLMLVFMLAAGAMLWEVELTPRLALVPILNVALVLRELLTATVSPALFSLVFVSSLAWAVAGILLATRVFESDALHQQRRRGPSRPGEPGDEPGAPGLDGLVDRQPRAARAGSRGAVASARSRPAPAHGRRAPHGSRSGLSGEMPCREAPWIQIRAVHKRPAPSPWSRDDIPYHREAYTRLFNTRAHCHRWNRLSLSRGRAQWRGVLEVDVRRLRRHGRGVSGPSVCDLLGGLAALS